MSAIDLFISGIKMFISGIKMLRRHKTWSLETPN